MNEKQPISYPRTPHIEGSNLQPGDGPAKDRIPLAALAERFPDAICVQEEKIDGAQASFDFSPDLEMRLFSRGHQLAGGPREFQFSTFKEWTAAYESELLEICEDRYRIFGEYPMALHTQFYDALPHFFMEFDVWDKVEERFLSTAARRRLLDGSCVTSVPVIHTGPMPRRIKDVTRHVGPSLYRTENWRDSLAEAAEAANVTYEDALKRTGAMDVMEGIYGKVEQGDEVVFRWKWVNPDFVQTILDNDRHWAEYDMIRNRLADGVDIFASLKTASPEP